MALLNDDDLPASKPVKNRSASKAKMEWMDRLDQIDPFFGNAEMLSQLLESAPTKGLREWLARQIRRNKLLEPLFRAPETVA